MGNPKKHLVHVVRIFTDYENKFGSKVTIVEDESGSLNNEQRLSITREVNFSETIFINNIKSADLSIFSKQGEISFASPLLGAAWYIEQKLGHQIEEIVCKDSKIKVTHQQNLIWISLPNQGVLPPWKLEELDDHTEIDKISPEDRPVTDHTIVWAWLNSESGEIRARTFAPAWEITEEEANGSGSMALSIKLNRSILVKHGGGSVIRVTNKNGLISVGGRICRDNDLLV